MTDCWIWVRAKVTGYGVAHRDGKQRLVHRMAWEVVNGTIPDGLEILHSCDNRACVNPEHLFLGTQLDNMRDMVAKGRQSFGERNGRHILTVAQVREVRRRRIAGEYPAQIGREMGIPRTTVSNITTHKAWENVQ